VASSLQSRFVTFDTFVPAGKLQEKDFFIRHRDVPPPRAKGEVLIKPLVFSIDPSMRGRLTGRGDYFLSQHVPGEPLDGPAVGRVVSSRHSDFAAGDLVRGTMSWADYSLWPAKPLGKGLVAADTSMVRIDPAHGKASHALSVYGAVGLTAYFGVTQVARPRRGETMLVSSAAGAVGTLAGQIAKIQGARVIGLTSSKTKRDILTSRLGFEAALDYRTKNLGARLSALIPGGPDIYFDNVGGDLSQAIMSMMRRPARVVECGQIATYDSNDESWMVNIRPIHANGLRFEGFNPANFTDLFQDALAQLREWTLAGQLIVLETEISGLEALPGALIGIFQSENIGKMLVTVAGAEEL
jgi:NADPH-dependent curcumin reductase CurA